MYGRKEMNSEYESWIYLSHRFFTLASNALNLVRKSITRERFVDRWWEEKKKNISREDIILWFLSDFLYELFFLLLLVKEVNTSHLLKKYVRKSDARRACDRRKERSLSLSSLSFNACISGKTEQRSRKDKRKGIARRKTKKKKRKKGSWDINFQLFSSLSSSLKIPRSNVIREKYLRKLSLGNRVPSIESKLRLDKCFNTF